MSAKTITALVRKILAAKESVGRLRERIAQLQRQIEQWSREVTGLLTAEAAPAAAVVAPAPRKRVAGRPKAQPKPAAPAAAASAPAKAAPAAAEAKTSAAPARTAKKSAAPKAASAGAQKKPARAAAAKGKSRITIREAVLKILTEKSPATVKEIREGVERLGGATKSLHVALSLLAKDKVIESAGRGQYRLPAKAEPPAETSQG